MSTGIVSVQGIADFHQRSPEFGLKMASDTSNSYGPPAERGALPCDDTHSATHYMDFSMFCMSNSTSTVSAHGRTPTISDPSAAASYTPPSIFTAAHALEKKQIPNTISPQQMRFDPTEASPASYTSSIFEEQRDGIRDFTYPQEYSHAQLSSGSSSTSKSHSPMTTKTGRRGKSEHVEPGSARDIYLQKNRHAASKCRRKQKRHQDELVEQARNVERRNKLLKAEVEMLRVDVRELMNFVGAHSDCPDSRLNLYLQRGANRLAHEGKRMASFSQTSNVEMPPAIHGHSAGPISPLGNQGV